MAIREIKSFKRDLILILDDIVKKLKLKEGDEINLSIEEKDGKKRIILEK